MPVSFDKSVEKHRHILLQLLHQSTFVPQEEIRYFFHFLLGEQDRFQCEQYSHRHKNNWLLLMQFIAILEKSFIKLEFVCKPLWTTTTIWEIDIKENEILIVRNKNPSFWILTSHTIFNRKRLNLRIYCNSTVALL